MRANLADDKWPPSGPLLAPSNSLISSPQSLTQMYHPHLAESLKARSSQTVSSPCMSRLKRRSDALSNVGHFQEPSSHQAQALALLLHPAHAVPLEFGGEEALHARGEDLEPQDTLLDSGRFSKSCAFCGILRPQQTLRLVLHVLKVFFLCLLWPQNHQILLHACVQQQVLHDLFAEGTGARAGLRGDKPFISFFRCCTTAL